MPQASTASCGGNVPDAGFGQGASNFSCKFETKSPAAHGLAGVVPSFPTFPRSHDVAKVKFPVPQAWLVIAHFFGCTPPRRRHFLEKFFAYNCFRFVYIV